MVCSPYGSLPTVFHSGVNSGLSVYSAMASLVGQRVPIENHSLGPCAASYMTHESAFADEGPVRDITSLSQSAICPEATGHMPLCKGGDDGRLSHRESLRLCVLQFPLHVATNQWRTEYFPKFVLRHQSPRCEMYVYLPSGVRYI